MKEKLLKEFPNYSFKFNEPMKRYTYTQLGGEAECMFFPKDEKELAAVFAYAAIQEFPLFILGNGSNLIIRDGGIKGIVVSSLLLNSIRVEGDFVVAQSGSRIIDVSFFAAEHSLSGLEFACGIPGTTGGAVFMNAGAYDGETKQVLDHVKAIDRNGHILIVNRDELGLEYRTSTFQENDLFIFEAHFKLTPGNKEESLAKMEHLNQLRHNSQPLEFPSCGSVFKRPPGHYAGQLIQQSHLQGFSVGGAQVSTKHAGFIVNKDNATSRDYISVIEHIQQTVRQNFDVELEREVKIFGED